MPGARRDRIADRLQRWLEARWYGTAPVPFWLGILSKAYGWFAARHRERAKASAQPLPVPVVVVGNLTVGGTGKTPVVIALVDALRGAGFRPGVVSRGYGGSARHPVEVPADADSAVHGDEPALIRLRTGAPVAVGKDRVAAARLLLDRYGVDVIVSDDGLQHYRLARDVEIAVIDGERRFGNGRLLPAGPLREPVARLRETGIVLVNGRRGPDEPGFDLRIDEAHSLDGALRRSLANFAGIDVHAVAGIGNPRRFFDALRRHRLNLIEHPFPDHHAFIPSDLAFVVAGPVLMTEKDAVKCRRFAQPDWYVVPARLTLPEGVLRKIVSLLRIRARRLQRQAAAGER